MPTLALSVPFLLAAALLIAPRGMKPHPSPFRMANEAKVVIEGTAAADGTVTVTKRWFVAPEATVGPTVVVPSLPLAAKVPFQFGLKNQPAITPDAVLLFLVHAKDGTWEPLLRIGGDNARGIVWFEGDQVWDYVQPINPGSYELSRCMDHTDKIARPREVAEVRAEVAAGLVARSKWEATLAIADAEVRAKAIAQWFGSQSPDGKFWSERIWADLGPAAKAEGARIVPHLSKVIATHAEGAAVSAACRTVVELGDLARDAVPSLIARLRDLRSAEAIDMVRALTTLADPRGIPVLLDLLDDERPWLVAEVAGALRHAGATGYAQRIADRIPNKADEAESRSWLVHMLDALHAADPELAERLVRERFLGEPELMSERHWLRRMRQ